MRRRWAASGAGSGVWLECDLGHWMVTEVGAYERSAWHCRQLM